MDNAFGLPFTILTLDRLLSLITSRRPPICVETVLHACCSEDCEAEPLMMKFKVALRGLRIYVVIYTSCSDKSKATFTVECVGM
jgi:hypothetical protein